MPPTVHVIVVNYNAGVYLERCLNSVLNGAVPVRVTVVDNASRDGSERVVHDLEAAGAPVELLRNEDNLGFARAVNRGLCRVRTPYVLVLNPDCFLEPEALGHLVEAMEARPRAAVAGALVRDPAGREERAARRRIPTPGSSLARLSGLGRWLGSFEQTDRPLPEGPVAAEAVSGACMLVRMQAVNDVGGLDEGYVLHCEDLDWFVRFRRRGWEILFVPQARVTHVKGACSTARPVWVAWHKHRGMLRFYGKHQRRHYPVPVTALVVMGVGLRFLLQAAAGSLRRLAGPRGRAG